MCRNNKKYVMDSIMQNVSAAFSLYQSTLRPAVVDQLPKQIPWNLAYSICHGFLQNMLLYNYFIIEW